MEATESGTWRALKWRKKVSSDISSADGTVTFLLDVLADLCAPVLAAFCACADAAAALPLGRVLGRAVGVRSLRRGPDALLSLGGTFFGLLLI
jgi:hypothetical protein